MKKILSIMLVLLMLLAVVPSTAMAASRKVYISSTGKGTMHMRGGPGYEYSVVGYVTHNKKVKTYDEDGDWTLVKNGKVYGWIRTMYIDGTTKALGNGFKAIVANSAVYASADMASAVKGAVTPADTVRVYYTENDMASVVVTDSGLSGWIPIPVIGVTVKVVPDNPPAYSDSVWRTTASTLNLRSGAGTQFAILGKIKRGTGVTILESVGNWRRVKTFGGQVGWISASYLTRQATAKVTASALNVRKGPGTYSAILGSFKRGTRVNVQYTSGNWAYVSTKRLSGYVSLNYLAF